MTAAQVFLSARFQAPGWFPQTLAAQPGAAAAVDVDLPFRNVDREAAGATVLASQPTDIFENLR